MALRDWPARRLARLWVAGLALQIALVAGLNALGRLTAPPEPPALRALRAWHDSVERGLIPPPREPTPAERAAIAAVLRDSLGITVRRAGDTVLVDGPPELRRMAGQLAEGMAQAGRAMVIIAALVFLPIPVALLLATLYWLVARRSRRRPEPLAPAA